MDDRKQFEIDRQANIQRLTKDPGLQELGLEFISRTAKSRYAYNFSWLGLPIIQFPQDMVALQEIMWTVKPDAVVEVGVARGGGLAFVASILELLGGERIAIGVDLDIREHNRAAIEAHPLAKRIQLIEGSSVERETVQRVEEVLRGRNNPLIILDSNHTHEHVVKELEAYSRFVRKGSYLVVFDTIIEDLNPTLELWPGRPWGRGNSPKTAVWQFLKSSDRFEIDKAIDGKLLVTVARDGYLRCIKD